MMLVPIHHRNFNHGAANGPLVLSPSCVTWILIVLGDHNGLVGVGAIDGNNTLELFLFLHFGAWLNSMNSI